MDGWFGWDHIWTLEGGKVLSAFISHVLDSEEEIGWTKVSYRVIKSIFCVPPVWYQLRVNIQSCGHLDTSMSMNGDIGSGGDDILVARVPGYAWHPFNEGNMDGWQTASIAPISMR